MPENQKTESFITKIILIDDDELTLYLSKRLLNTYIHGAQIKSFANGMDALNFLKIENAQNRFTILLDINMPGYSGWDFLEDYAETHRTDTIYMFSSSIDRRDMERSGTYPAVKGFISKPIDPDKAHLISTNSKH